MGLLLLEWLQEHGEMLPMGPRWSHTTAAVGHSLTLPLAKETHPMSQQGLGQAMGNTAPNQHNGYLMMAKRHGPASGSPHSPDPSPSQPLNCLCQIICSAPGLQG